MFVLIFNLEFLIFIKRFNFKIFKLEHWKFIVNCKIDN